LGTSWHGTTWLGYELTGNQSVGHLTCIIGEKLIASVSNHMPSVPWPTYLTLFAGGIGSPPSPADHHSPPTTSSQVAAGLSRLRLHATGCSATAIRPVRMSHKRTYSDSLDHAASRSLTAPGEAIGYNRKRVSSFNRFFGFQFRF